MVRLTKIYTRTGDKGRTRLGDMSETDKHDLRVEAYGAVDELNAALGLAVCGAGDNHPLTPELTRIQNDLFDLGADLCVPDRGETLDWEPLRMTPAQTDWLEARIDAHNEKLEPLDSFILPGGAELSARLHLARTIARRAERRTVELASRGDVVGAPAITYLNRVSDYLFVAARIANDDGARDVKWIPGANR
ncbi:MAG: ATP:cob(I)alamin adenosyltransferase [Oceanicaulis sp.]|uniref:cob(I)yrinic acid a,c-diamide adenosyltransferase n=1 Tax=Oceanicaulis sp. UBA2681 TaxID=1947007 RepID=UPI000C095052|nr:cob(I)yrinic acid a,c-diamide adenosyltransferase [Oceanicaulis sp. UBA2681]MAP49731.1 ATP:cob(I)alamin adenosyltransferase [Oceanicaulis sp.]|tara:strand:+ start:5260 stop:5835 length:576 start_codon:yes stop_codon:yes gene_type:complete